MKREVLEAQRGKWGMCTSRLLDTTLVLFLDSASEILNPPKPVNTLDTHELGLQIIRPADSPVDPFLGRFLFSVI